MSSSLVGFNIVPLSWLPAEGLLLISLRKLSQSGELPNALTTAAPHSRTCAVFPAFPLWGARPKWAPVEGDVSICHQIPSRPLLESTLSSPRGTFSCFLLLGIHSPQASHDLPLTSFRSLLRSPHKGPSLPPLSQTDPLPGGLLPWRSVSSVRGYESQHYRTLCYTSIW